MIKKEKKKIYYTTDVVTDVVCDNCGKKLTNEDDFIRRVEVLSLYYMKDRPNLSSSDFYDYSLDLCDDCYKPIKQLLDGIDKKI